MNHLIPLSVTLRCILFITDWLFCGLLRISWKCSPTRPPGNAHQPDLLEILTSSTSWKRSPAKSPGNPHQPDLLEILTSSTSWKRSPARPLGVLASWPANALHIAEQFPDPVGTRRCAVWRQFLLPTVVLVDARHCACWSRHAGVTALRGT